MKIIIVLLLSIFMSSCYVPPPLENIAESLKKMMGMAFQQLATPSPSPTPALDPKIVATKANAELLTEMFQVTFNKKEIEDPSQFSGLLSSLNQGASLEGVYRGLIMGARYRVTESKAKAASPAAIKFFASEMSELQAGMKNPTEFSKITAKEFPTIEYPEGTSDSGSNSLTFGNDQQGAQEKDKNKKDKNALAAEMLQDFIGATPYTLKRVLSEEILKKVDELKDSRADLAHWYAGLVVHLSDANTDFGLPQRNSSDFDFHFRFAMAMSQDRVMWEVLNRYHRIINRIE